MVPSLPPYLSEFSIALATEANGTEISSAERSLISDRANEQRRAEFIRGRLAAQLALERLGEKEHAVLRVHGTRIPFWPSHVVGSISHTSSLAIAIVGYKSCWRGVGIDIETVQSVDSALAQRIATPSELDQIGSERDVITLFSAKESIYKLLFPLVRAPIGFQDVTVCWASGRPYATLHRSYGSFPQGTIVPLFLSSLPTSEIFTIAWLERVDTDKAVSL